MSLVSAKISLTWLVFLKHLTLRESTAFRLGLLVESRVHWEEQTALADDLHLAIRSGVSSEEVSDVCAKP